MEELKVKMTIKEFEIQLALGTLSMNDKVKLAKDRRTPKEILFILSTDKDNYIRCRVAYNPNTPKGILKKLSKDENRFVKAYVAGNPSTPIEVLKILSTSKDYICRANATDSLNSKER